MITEALSRSHTASEGSNPAGCILLFAKAEIESSYSLLLTISFFKTEMEK